MTLTVVAEVGLLGTSLSTGTVQSVSAGLELELPAPLHSIVEPMVKVTLPPLGSLTPWLAVTVAVNVVVWFGELDQTPRLGGAVTVVVVEVVVVEVVVVPLGSTVTLVLPLDAAKVELPE